MKILFWTPLFWPEIGGIETASAGLLKGLTKKNCEFMVITSHGRKRLEREQSFNGIPVYRFPIISALLKKDLNAIKQIISKTADLKMRFRPDIVHVNFGGPAPVSYLHMKTRGSSQAPCILSLHNSVRGMECGPDTLLGRMFRTSSWITACSEAMTEDARGIMPEITGKSSTVYYGLEMPEVNPAPLSLSNPNILCIGRIVKEKGFDLAIKAFSLIKGRIPSMKMTVAGDGPELPALKEEASRFGIRRRMEFTGPVQPEDVPQIINKASAVVVPSRWREAFGLVALEAAQMGRPVIAAGVGGLKEAVVHEKTGLLFENGNPEALAESMVRILYNPEKTKQMGLSARRRAQRFFSLSRYMESILEIYERIL